MTKMKRIFTFCIAIIMLLCFASACSEQPKESENIEKVKGEVVATVGDTKIFDYELRYYATMQGISTDEALNYLTESTQMVHYAEANGMKVSQEDIDATKAQIEKEKTENKNFASFLGILGIDEGQYQSVVLTHLKYVKAFEKVMQDGKLKGFTPADVRMHFDKNFLCAKHILIAFTDEEGNTRTEQEALQLASEVKRRLEAGEDVDGLIEEFSDDPDTEAAPLGYVFANQRLYPSEIVPSMNRFGVIMAPEFNDAVAALEPGEISEPVKTEFGYHVILRLEHKDDTIYATGRDDALNVLVLLNQEAYEKELNAFVTEMNKKYPVKTNDEAVKKQDAEIEKIMLKFTEMQMGI